MPIRVSNVTSQILFNPSDIFAEVEQTLDLIEEPFARKIRCSNFTIQILQLQSGMLAFASDEMELSDFVVVLNAAGDRQPLEDILAFTQTASVSSHPILEDVLVFEQTARSSIWNIDLAQKVSLNQSVGVCSGAPWTPIVIEDVLAFVQVGAKVEIGIASDTLTFTDSIVQINSPVGDGHFIDFQQTVSVGKGLEVESEINFSQTIQTFSDFLRSVTHADVVQHAMTYYIDNGCNKKGYSRFVGEGTADAIDLEGLLFESAFVLESIETGTVVVMRSPETDDNERLGFNRINRETRGGELNVYADPNWAEVNTLLFTITALPDGHGNCPDVLNQFLDFVHDNLGHEIFLHDWTGVSWRGVITRPDEAATEDADGYWTVTFEFEGIAEEGSVPNSVMNIQQQLTFNADWNRPLAQTLGLTQAVTVGGDIHLEVEQDLGITDSVSGVQEITMMFDNLSGGSGAATLDNTLPTTPIGSTRWRSHTEIKDDGTMDSPIDAGAYYRFTPVDGTRYELEFGAAFVNTYSDGDNCIFGFYEDQSPSNTLSGPSADGTLNPTAAKAVHLMREVDGGTRQNAYRLGTDSDGTATTIQWTDGTLRASPDSVLDLKIILDTTGGEGNWTATWYAKGILSGSYTEVGPATQLLSENIGAVGWSQDSVAVEGHVTSFIRLKELRPV